MKEPSEFELVFVRLRAILQPHASRFSVKRDTPTAYCLEGGVHPKHKQLFPVAWVEIRKGYVSFHHMGIYEKSNLVLGASKALRARMQGKSCFNFKTVDEGLFKELEQLTVKGFEALREWACGIATAQLPSQNTTTRGNEKPKKHIPPRRTQ
jgi:hypothetical protein